jgi:hypothetical protein
MIKHSHFALLAMALLLFSCAQTEQSHLTDLAIATYTPLPDALRLAETRAKQYWAKRKAELGQTRYLAIESDVILSDEIPDLYMRLTNSPGVNSSDIEEYEANNDITIYCVNIFDTTTGKFVSRNGYAIVDEPPRGSLARFGNYTAVFIGTGG